MTGGGPGVGALGRGRTCRGPARRAGRGPGVPVPARTVPSPARPRLLVCDARPVVRLGLRAVLAEAGLVGDCPPDRLDAAVAALSPDLVVAGVPADDRDAYPRIAAVLRRTAGLRVVVVADRVDDGGRHAAALAGARGLVPCDAAPEELLATVRSVLEGRDALPAPATDDVPDAARSLRARDLDVLDLVAEGLTNAEIAERLDIAPRTAKTHVQHLIDRLGARDRTAAVARAFRLGLLR